jgi:hypothetical protein
MSQLGLLGRLPLELREIIYTIICEQVIHCCCSPQKHGKGNQNILIESPEFQQQGLADFYWDCCVECAQSDYLPLLRKTTPWFSTICPTTGLDFRASDLLSLLLTCKDIWLEAEPIAWKKFTLCLGLSQLETFHKRFLKLPLRSETSQTPRSIALRNLQLSIPNFFTLASQVGRSKKSHGLSGHQTVGDACRDSIKALGECSKLQNMDFIVSLDPQISNYSIQFQDIWIPLMTKSHSLVGMDVYYAQNLPDRAFLLRSGQQLANFVASPDAPHQCFIVSMGLAAKDMMTTPCATLPSISDSQAISDTRAISDSLSDETKELWDYIVQTNEDESYLVTWRNFQHRFRFHLESSP